MAADETLRLPTTIFRGVFNLGPKNASRLMLPKALAQPELFADWDEENSVCSLFVEYDDGQLHFDRTATGTEYHFHRANGESSSRSPWSSRDTVVLLEWATLLSADFFARMPDLMEDFEEAAAWQEAGYPLYVCETDPAFLDLLEVEIEGELLTLPWLGSGEVAQEHLEGDNHLVALLWNGSGGEPDREIARAWVDPATDEPATSVAAGIDWDAVGLPADEVSSWFEGTYLNHHIIPDGATALITAALERMGGLR